MRLSSASRTSSIQVRHNPAIRLESRVTCTELLHVRVELDIAEIRKRLEWLCQSLANRQALETSDGQLPEQTSSPPRREATQRAPGMFTSITGVMRPRQTEGNFTTSYPIYLRGFPFMTLQTKSFMELLGLDSQLTQQIVTLEHQSCSTVAPMSQNQFMMLRRESVLR
jgi:hypothetical protein